VIPCMNSNFDSIREEIQLTDKKFSLGNGSAMISEWKLANLDTQDLRNRFGNFSVTPGG